MRHLLMSSAAQIFRAPEDDNGSDFDPLDDFTDEADDLDDDEPVGSADDDEGDDDADDTDDEDDDEPQRPVKKQSRAAKRVEALAADNAELKRRLDDVIRSQQQPTGPSQAELERQEAQTLAAMTPEERVGYLIEKTNRNTNAAVASLQFQIQDTADRAAFEALCSRKPAVAKLRGKVEEALAEMRKGGNTAPRETVLAYLIGQGVLNGKSNAPRQRQRAAENRDRQRAEPGANRSDKRAESGGRATDRASRAKRLEGKFI